MASSIGRLAGNFAIVTGGASGIGRAICQLFAKEGASVAVLDINSKGIEETISQMHIKDGMKHCAIKADVTSAEQAKYAIKQAEEELGKKTNVLINNAGIMRGGLLSNLSEKDFDDVININLKGTFLMTKEFLSSLKGSSVTDTFGRGVIVNISSIAGKCGFFNNGDYSAAKFGVLGLTKTIAQEYPKHKVRCNAVLPGMTDTSMVEVVDALLIERSIRQVPMRRLGKPEEIANACLFLASAESSFVNGACLEVTGGFGL